MMFFYKKLYLSISTALEIFHCLKKKPFKLINKVLLFAYYTLVLKEKITLVILQYIKQITGIHF